MKKTININLAGRSFIIDEDAYEMLGNYLQTVSYAFSDSQDGREVCADIEDRAAELFSDMLAAQRSCIIDIDMTRDIIDSIGQPSQFEMDVTAEEQVIGLGLNSASVEEDLRMEERLPPPFPQPSPLPRRFFRNPDNQMLGGVCSGIAAYLNADVTMVRLLTAALCFLSFSTVGIVYLILWIVVPQASTPLQKMQMQGISPSMQNIAEAVTGCSSQPGSNNSKGVGNTLAKIFATVGKVLLAIVLAVGCAVALSCLVAMVIGAIGLVYHLAAPAAMLPDWLEPTLTGLQRWTFIGAMIGVFGSITIPVYTIWKLVFSKHSTITGAWAVKLLLAWVLSLLLATLMQAL